MAEEPKSFARRDRLAAMEGPAQERWKADKIFEAKAEFNEDGSPKEKFMVTFPYPYMNGRLHLGHAYSMSKVTTQATKSILIYKCIRQATPSYSSIMRCIFWIPLQQCVAFDTPMSRGDHPDHQKTPEQVQ